MPDDLRFLPSHEWVRIEGDIAIIGISDFAVKQLTDLTYVDLPEAGTRVEKFARFGEVESVKAVSDVYSPVDGEVVEVNEGLNDDIEPLSRDPYGTGWLLKVKVEGDDPLCGLMDKDAYDKSCEEGGH